MVIEISSPAHGAYEIVVARQQVDMAAAWSVDRLGRSLPDLVAFLSEVRAAGCDLYLHQQAIDTSTPAGRMMFQLLGVFAEFERAIITSRILAGQARARAKGVRMGRPPVAPIRLETVRRGLQEGRSIRAVAQAAGVSPSTVSRIKQTS